MSSFLSLFTLARATHPGRRLPDSFKRFKMMARILLFFKYHRRVEAIFERHSLRQIVSANPRIYEKIYREYLYFGASKSERLRLLESNYRFISEFFPASFIKSIYVDHNFNLCTIPLSGPSALNVRLAYHDRFEKEGELTLGLYDETNNRLYSVSFSLQCDGMRTAVIGCLIGGGSLEQEKFLTKAMHGMRPKNLIFFILQCFLRNLAVEKLWAVGTDSHIYWARARRRERIKFDYDVFWEEVGGWRGEKSRHFFLPLKHERRTPQEIRTNKRALYQRRYAMLDDIDAQIRHALVRVSTQEDLGREAGNKQEDVDLTAAA